MASCPLLSQALSGTEAPSITHKNAPSHKHLAVKSQGSPAVTSHHTGGGGKGAWELRQEEGVGVAYVFFIERGRVITFVRKNGSHSEEEEITAARKDK